MLVVTLEKSVETWWRAVVAGHPEIDATLVDSTKRVEDYDDETQVCVGVRFTRLLSLSTLPLTFSSLFTDLRIDLSLCLLLSAASVD